MRGCRDSRRQREREHDQPNKIREKSEGNEEAASGTSFLVNEGRTVARIRFVEKGFGSKRI
jgi:hypothetical protein